MDLGGIATSFRKAFCLSRIFSRAARAGIFPLAGAVNFDVAEMVQAGCEGLPKGSREDSPDSPWAT